MEEGRGPSAACAFVRLRLGNKGFPATAQRCLKTDHLKQQVVSRRPPCTLPQRANDGHAKKELRDSARFVVHCVRLQLIR